MRIRNRLCTLVKRVVVAGLVCASSFMFSADSSFDRNFSDGAILERVQQPAERILLLKDCLPMFELENSEGERVIKDLNQLEALKEYKVSYEEAQEFLKQGLDQPYAWVHEKEIPGISYFVDTEKPNSLVIASAVDHNNTYVKKEDLDFIVDLKEGYDVVVKVAEKDTEICQYLEIFPRGSVYVLKMGGHGDYEEGEMRLNDGDDESNFIDLTDTELGECFRKYLHPEAVVILDSCGSGEENEDGEMLAKFVLGLLERGTVYAASESTRTIEVETLGPPLEVRLFNESIFSSGIRNVTYKISKE